VRDLFFNVPARYKFLKRDQTEQGYIADLISRLALARADISFRLTAKQKDIIHTPGNNNLLSAIYVLYGRETAEAMVEVNYQLEPIKINGYITTPQVTRGNRSRQVVFVNGRNISSKVVNAAINEASKTWFMKGKFPSLVINLEIPLNLVDVNASRSRTTREGCSGDSRSPGACSPIPASSCWTNQRWVWMCRHGGSCGTMSET